MLLLYLRRAQELIQLAHCSLPALSRVSEKLLVTQLRQCIHTDLHILREQFEYMKGTSTSNAGVLLTSTITAAINQ